MAKKRAGTRQVTAAQQPSTNGSIRAASNLRLPHLWRLGFLGFTCAAALLAAANLSAPGLLLHLRHKWSQQAAAAGSNPTHNYSSISNLSVLHSTTIGDKTYQPAFGIYPKGCKWRDVVLENSTQVQYEYWDVDGERWSQQQPAACVLQGFQKPGPPHPWQMYKNNPRTGEALILQAFKQQARHGSK